MAISSINSFEAFGSKDFTTIIMKSVARHRQTAYTNLGKRHFKPQIHELRLKYDILQWSLAQILRNVYKEDRKCFRLKHSS